MFVVSSSEISPSSMEPPLYYGVDNQAAFYGALGTVLAQTMSETFDIDGIRHMCFCCIFNLSFLFHIHVPAQSLTCFINAFSHKNAYSNKKIKMKKTTTTTKKNKKKNNNS